MQVPSRHALQERAKHEGVGSGNGKTEEDQSSCSPGSIAPPECEPFGDADLVCPSNSLGEKLGVDQSEDIVRDAEEQPRSDTEPGHRFSDPEHAAVPDRNESRDKGG